MECKSTTNSSIHLYNIDTSPTAPQKPPGMPIIEVSNFPILSLILNTDRPPQDTAFIYIGGLPFDLSEGDVLTIFSQYGEPTYINLIRDRESGKSKGFCFLKYEDQRSTDLAVDNLGGATVMGRVLKVDHTRYKRKDGEEEEERVRSLQGELGLEAEGSGSAGEQEEKRELIKEEVELMKLEREHDEDDPMKEFLMEEKREEVRKALAKMKTGKEGEKRRHHHHHRRHNREDGREDSRRDVSDKRDDREERRHGHRHHHRRRSRSP